MSLNLHHSFVFLVCVVKVSKAELAFGVPLDDPHDVCKCFLKCIKKACMDCGLLGDYFAPYIAMVQSSGWGKSRLLKLLQSLYPLCLYLCVGKEQSYPPPSAAVHSLFDVAHESPEEAVQYFTRLLLGLRDLVLQRNRRIPHLPPMP
jgi:hypothetical protein